MNQATAANVRANYPTEQDNRGKRDNHATEPDDSIEGGYTPDLDNSRQDSM